MTISELSLLQSEVSLAVATAREFEEKLKARDQKRLELVEQLKDMVPKDQYNKFYKGIQHLTEETNEKECVDKDQKEKNKLYIDKENPIESLRKIRCEIAREVIEIMDTS